LAQTYRNSGPFKGAVLAGVFTDGAITQLQSLGFTVLYVPYQSVVGVFRKFGVDASFDEDTPDREFQKKVSSYERLDELKRKQLARRLISDHQKDVDAFVKSLSISASRQIERIVILALHGALQEVLTVDDAIHFIENYSDDGKGKPVDRYEIEVRYNNGDTIEGKFKNKSSAIEFLRIYEVPPKVV
jgi:hypothetical protein